MLAMICRLAFRTSGVTLVRQLLANGIELGLMIALVVAAGARTPSDHKKFRH
jgi:hypothetical protein